MKKVLVVEDSAMVMKVLKHVLSNTGLFECVFVDTFGAAKDAVENSESRFFAAVVDLNLPDAPQGEVVDFTLEEKIPTIVLTGSFDEERREKLLAKGIVDYVTKQGRFSYNYVLNMLKRLIKNQDVKVLVVDDSDTARKFVANLLRLHLYQVIEASDGVQGIKLILEHPDLKLLITDYNMPRMDGCELVKNIRLKYEKADLVIIGLSSEGEGALSARFIKSGANDFLRKPFNHEEFYCRITHNMEFLDLIEGMREQAKRDELTGAYSRKYFYEVASAALADATAADKSLSLAVIDLDEFQRINEQYGLDIGDRAMCSVVQEFNTLFERFTYARAGGKKFYCLMPGLNNEMAVAFVDKVRQIICSEPLAVGEYAIPISFTAGVCSNRAESLSEMIGVASENLMRATEAGGDLVFGDD